MEYLSFVVLGLIQGVTEFLPISSSGHIYLTEHVFGLAPSLSLALWLHIGSLAAVVVYFWRDVFALLFGLWDMLIHRHHNTDGVLALKLLVATILTFPTALLVKQFVLDDLSLALVGTTLIITAALLLVAEYARPDTERSLSWWLIITLGLVQGIAVVPGISRSGLTIAFLIMLGINRKESARVSFLLAIPTILGAFVFALLDTTAITDLSLSGPTAVAVLVSAIAGWLSIRWMMDLVQGKWIYFVPYCLLLGLAVLFV